MKTHLKKSGMAVVLMLSMALSACTETGTVPPVSPTPPTSPAPGTDPTPPSNPVPPSDPTPTPPAPTPTPPAPSPTPPSDPVPPSPTYGYITGTVVNEQGVPLPGVEVVADNTAAYNSNLITRTDAQGRYKIDVRNAPVTFNMSATMTIRYEGHSIGVNLVPDNTETVPGGVGGVRNFTFKPKPLSQADPYGNLACVFVEREPGNFSVDPAKLILTLTPIGTLADGTTGSVRTTKVVMSGGGWVAANIMWGTYKVTATMDGQPVELRRRIGGMDTYEWGMSYTGGFTRDYQSLQPNMFLEVRMPKN